MAGGLNNLAQTLGKTDANGALVVTLAAGSAVVTSITGTANQITASAATGAVTLSIPSTFIAPGSIASTTDITSGGSLIALSSGRMAFGTTRTKLGSSGDNLLEVYNAAQTEGFQIRISADGTMQVRTRASTDAATITAATVNATSAYQANGTPGVTAGPFTAITSITVTDGLVTALTGT